MGVPRKPGKKGSTFSGKAGSNPCWQWQIGEERNWEFWKKIRRGLKTYPDNGDGRVV